MAKRPMTLLCRLAGVVAALGVGLLGAVMARASGNAPVVVELYTSQGCSSCPPADALLGEIARRPNVVALAFHVDYWDYIGWQDRFSIPQATSRQRGYVETLGLSSAFTPQVVINGRASFVGSDRREITAALTAAAEASTEASTDASTESSQSIPITAAVVNGELRLSLPERREQRDFDVNVVAYVPEATTVVGRGENSGRTLSEYNVVRQFRRVGTWKGESNTLRIPVSSFPADATRVAVLLQQSRQGAIAGSALAVLR
jgi:hypothetical protein